ncbi:MAG: hypothetical protein J5802_10495 [Butyrivibrio sp.]|nr:hypothetical protein [Butyrivibrio sp.]
MINRFEHKNSIIFRVSDTFFRWISVIILVIICFAFYYVIDASGRNTIERQQSSLENVINRDIVQCYAIEGRYPPSLTYLEEHYGLVYDRSTFFVDYRPIASNMYPDVTVIKAR